MSSSPPGITGMGALRFFGGRLACSLALWSTKAMIGFVGCCVMYGAAAPQPFARGLLGYGTERTVAAPLPQIALDVACAAPFAAVSFCQTVVRVPSGAALA